MKRAGNHERADFFLTLRRDTHMITIKAIAIVLGAGTAAYLFLEEIGLPDTLLAIVSCFT